MLAITHAPAAGKGRRRIAGTILSDSTGPMCLVRKLFSGAENAGNTGSPRVEIWLALRERTLIPVAARGWKWGNREMTWEAMERGPHELGDGNRELLRAMLLKLGYAMSDVWMAGEHRKSAPTWPLSPWDGRVILPDDERWPKGQRSTPKIKFLRQLLALESTWQIDAMILAHSLRETGD